MRTLEVLLATVVIMLGISCGGNSKQEPIPDPTKPVKTYGTFRGLSPVLPQSSNGESKLSNADGTITIAGRINHRSILMMNGKVLLWGGDSDSAHPSLDIYDPNTESFSRSNAIPNLVRYYHKGSGGSYSSFGLCNLPNGNVLAFGGARDLGDTSFAEMYNPETDTISIAFQMSVSQGPVEELLYVGNNKVIVFQSGYSNMRLLDMTTETYEDLLMPVEEANDSSILQDANGNIWKIGGRWGEFPNWDTWVSKPYILKYNPVNNTWTRKADLLTSRYDATLVLLPGNKIGIYGGTNISWNPSFPNTKTENLKSVEIYDIATDTISYSEAMVGERQQARSVYLQTGYTLIAGGADVDNLVVDTELVHRHDIGFSGSTGKMIHGRYGHSVVSLPNGLVLITGGTAGVIGDGVDETAEIYDPQSRLYIKYPTEVVVVGDTLQLSTEYAAGVDWSLLDTDSASITNTGLLTANTVGVIEVKATAKDDSTLTAVIRITIIPE